MVKSELPSPYFGYTCGINYENEMRDIPVTLSRSETPEVCCDDECGWFEVSIEPIKVITPDDHPYYFEYDPDRRVIDARDQIGRLMLIPISNLMVVMPARNAWVFFPDNDPPTENMLLAVVKLNRIIQDGSACQLKKSYLDKVKTSINEQAGEVKL